MKASGTVVEVLDSTAQKILGVERRLLLKERNDRKKRKTPPKLRSQKEYKNACFS